MLKTIVVGAGGGGLASALLATLRDEKVTLIESHSKLGGCASFFKRGPFIFDAGATTISGVGEGEPLGRLFALLGKRPSLKLADPGIVFHLSDGRILHYHHNQKKWIDELEAHFPHLPHRKFWELVHTTNKRGWEFLKSVPTFPLKNPWDLLPFLKHPESFLLLHDLLRPMDLVMKEMGLVDPLFDELINGILLISAQTEARYTPFLVGAMALAYPGETYIPLGGMKNLMDFFEEELTSRGVDILKRTRVTSFKKGEVTLENGEVLEGNQIILNLPIWNLSKMNPSLKLMRESEKHPGYWGAFMVYLGTKSQERNPYHQIHIKNWGHYFVSFSLPEDHLKAPEGYQAVTISTHVRAQDWMHLSHEDYEAKKMDWGELILRDFRERFKITETKFETFGTPESFVHYTGRENGFVGGVPFRYGKNPFTLLSPVIEKDVYRVGDTIFPGQGLTGVVAGALNLHARLT